VAHPARVYDYWLSGKDHYQADRDAAQAVTAHRPQAVAGARANRLDSLNYLDSLDSFK
jgi:hypothetical protein